MSVFSRSAVVFVSSHRGPGLADSERAFVPVMAELVRQGAHVHLISPPGAAIIEPARAIGVSVAPYRLSRANVVRTVSRVRKYLRRLDPLVGHSSGVEAAVLLRLAARPLGMLVVNTIGPEDWPPKVRRRATTKALRSIARRTAGDADLVLVDSAQLRDRLVAEGGYDPETVTVMPESLGSVAASSGAPDSGDPAEAVVNTHLAVYERLADLWGGPAPARGPKRRRMVRRVRRDARRAAKSDGRVGGGPVRWG